MKPRPAGRARRVQASLLALLRIGVATMARPDAAHKVSTMPTSRWRSWKLRVLSFDPERRRKTRNYPAFVLVLRGKAAVLGATDSRIVAQ